MSRKPLLIVLAALALAAVGAPAGALADGPPAPAAAGTPSPPAKLFQKNWRLSVNLEDVQDLVFDATLYEVPSSVPAKVRDYLNEQLDGATFEVDATKAACFIVFGDRGKKVPCSQIADMVDSSPDGGVSAAILARPVAGDPLSFLAKKITVWVDASEADTPPPAEAPKTTQGASQAPPKFFQKNWRLSVNLEDVQDLVFDATLYEVPSSVPAKVRDYLNEQLDGTTFEIDAKKAKCFIVKHDAAGEVPCSQIADLLDASPDGGIYATILARAVAGDELSFRAKKITIWL